MNELTTITTARVSVVTGVLSSAPQKLTLNLQNKILSALKVIYGSATNTVGGFTGSGFRVVNNGRVLIPGFGSVDEVTNTPYAGVPSFGEFLNFENLNVPLEGTPYNLDFEFYNTGGITAVYYIYAITTPQIQLPPAPIVADQKKDD